MSRVLQQALTKYLGRWSALTGLSVLLSVAGVPTPASPADLPVDAVIETNADIDQLLEQGVIDNDTAEALAALLNAPIDLNRASRRQLQQLPGIDRSLADAIIALRQRGPVNPDTLIRTGTLSANEAAQLRPFVTDKHITVHWQTRQGMRTYLARAQIPAVWQRLERTGSGHLQRTGLLWQLQRTTWHRVGSDGVDVVVATPPVQPRPTRYGVDITAASLQLIAGTWAMRNGEGLAFATGHPTDGEAALELRIRPGFRLVPDCRTGCRSETLADPEPLSAQRGLIIAADVGRTRLRVFAADTVQNVSAWSVARADDQTTSVTFWQQMPNTTPIELRRSLPLLREQLIGLSALFRHPRFRAGCVAWAARPRWRVSPPLTFTAAARFPRSPGWGVTGCWSGVDGARMGIGTEVATSVTAHTGAAATLRLTAARPATWELRLWHYGDRWNNPHSTGPASPLQHDGDRGRGESGVRFSLRRREDFLLNGRTELAWHRISTRWRADARTTISSLRSRWNWAAGVATRLLITPGTSTDWRISPLLRVLPAGGRCRIETRLTMIGGGPVSHTPTATFACTTSNARSFRVHVRGSAGVQLPEAGQTYMLRIPVEWRRRDHRIRTGPDLYLNVEDELELQAWWTLRWDWSRRAVLLR